MKTLNIGRDFSLDPAGRFFSDEGDNGEKFRENFLKPAIQALKPDEKLHIILDDGVESYGSSFLSEGFAGMVKYGYISSQNLLEKIVIDYSDADFEFYKNKIITYIKNSKFKEEEYKPTRSKES
ncbi:MAG TPA: DUF4325 domain-containing protein [Gallionella sp.]|nr:DUF4325 domain-containing protein [Gallionella sp.]